MNDDHVDPVQFVKALEEYGQLGWRAAVRTHVHLVEGCPECARRVLDYHQLGSLRELLEHDNPAGELFRRQYRREGAALAAWLESLSQAERLEQVAKDEKLRRQLVLVSLHRRVRELWSGEPQKALELAQVALAILPRLVDSPTDIEEEVEVEARTWSYYGNVQRILSDLPEADRAFRLATRILKKFGGKDEIDAELWSFKASLRRDQRRWADALAAVGAASRIYGELEKWSEQGQQLLLSAKIHCDSGKPKDALSDLHRAIPLLATSEEPRLRYVPLGLLMHVLCELGRFDEARERLPEAYARCALHGSPTDLLRLRWCEAKIAAALGPAAPAETAFLEVRQGFIDQAIGYDVALVSLDLAVLYAEQGRSEEIRALAEEMYAIFQSRQVQTEALAAAFLFCQATRKDQASLEALRAVRERLKEAHRI